VLDIDTIKVTPRDQQVLDLLVQGCSNNRDRRAIEHQPAHRQAALAHSVSTRRNPRGAQARAARHCRIRKGGGEIMMPCERLTPKEVQVATRVWEGLTNREIGRLLGTTEQVIKNHLRSAFDKLGVWSRLELAMYVASHGGKNWMEESGLGRAS
jgi:DNA-binding NarL/FixJ family response regulator